MTVKKIKSSINDFFSKCDQIRRKLGIWSYLLKKFLMENFSLCGVSNMLIIILFHIIYKPYLQITESRIHLFNCFYFCCTFFNGSCCFSQSSCYYMSVFQKEGTTPQQSPMTEFGNYQKRIVKINFEKMIKLFSI